MAKIPLPEGREQITRQPLAARQGPGVFSTDVARASQEFAKTAADVAKQFEEAQTLAEKTNAETQALRKLKELNLEAQSITTIEDIAKFRSDYPNRISKIREESSKAITLPQAKNEFGRSFDRDKILFDFNIRSTLQNNQNIALEGILNENILEQRDSFVTGNSVEGQIAETNRDLLLSEAINRGALTTKEARGQKDNQRKEWRLARAYAHIENDATQFLIDVALGEEGIYGDIDAKDRLTLETAARKKVERNKKVAEKVINEKHTKNEIDLTAKYFANQLSFEEIQEQFMSGDISQKYAGILDSLLTNPEAVNATTDEAQYTKLINEYLKLDEANLDDLRKFKIKVLGTHSFGDLSRPDTEFLINKTIDPFTKQKEEGKGFLAATIEAIKNWASTAIVEGPVAVITKMINKLLNRVDEKSTEENIVKTGQDIIKEQRKELNPSIGTTSEKGTLMIDAFGNKARVFPDGRIEEID